MTARVLVVDDLLPNIKLLEARLTAEYFDVLTSTNGPEAIEACKAGLCDIVLLDIMMPGMDGFEVCTRLKADPTTSHIPVVMVTALDQAADRVRGLDCGADDFLTKPVDEVALIARVKSLSRLKVTLDELRSRAAASARLGRSDPFVNASAADGHHGRVLVVDDRPASSDRIIASLRGNQTVDVETNPQEALFRAAEQPYDLIIVSLGLTNYDGLRLCSQLRSLERTRALPILTIADLEDRPKILRGLDLGVNDYLVRPIDRNELIARVRTQVRRKRYAESLRNNVEQAIEMAVVDALTGLNNRRYFDMNLASLLDQAAQEAKPLSLLVLDIDFFKKVNDTYGHDVGDVVIKGLGEILKRVKRNTDVVARFGGEEFVILVPGGQVYDLRLKLAAQGLPKGGAVGFELMDGQKFGVSQFAEQVNYQRALAGELSRSIQSIASVQNARVHLAIPRPSVFVREQQQSSASVIVSMYPGRVLDAGQVSAIQHMVSSSVPELLARNVTVVDQAGNLLSAASGESSTELDASQLKYLHTVESSYASRIENILKPIVGAENVRAQVTAALDFNRVEQTSETFKPNPAPGESAVRSQQTSESNTPGQAVPAGVPGAASAPSLSRASATSGAASASFTSVFMRAMICSGKPAGPTRPYHCTASKPGSAAASASVGSSGAKGARVGLETASALIWPAATRGSKAGPPVSIILMWPPARSFTAGDVPR